MRPNLLVGALVAAGVIGTGAAAFKGHIEAPFAHANAATAVAAAGVATPAANPSATTLPLTGFTELVKRYGPAVVNVSVEGTRRVAGNGDEGEIEIPGLQQIPPQFRDFFRGMPRGRGAPRGEGPLMRGQGSGFIVSNDGYIITNAHVVENADVVTVRLTDRREYRAKVVGADKQSDIAVLKVDAKNLPVVQVGDPRGLKAGEWVIAIGSPFGFENSVTAGIVSAKARSLPDANYTQFIQTDVAVNPGNSGGPLFNLAGEVIGINSQIYSRTGGYQGIAFAIPINVAAQVKEQLVKYGKVERGRIGVAIQEVTQSLAQSFGLDKPQGALVASVEPGGPADKAGLKPGDVLLAVNGKAVDRSAELPPLVAAVKPGSKASLDVWRDGAKRSLAVTVGELKPDQVVRAPEQREDGGKLGLALRQGEEGLVVERASGPAARAGIRSGDVVVAVNGKRLKNAEELRTATAKAKGTVALLVKRGEQSIFVPIELG